MQCGGAALRWMASILQTYGVHYSYEPPLCLLSKSLLLNILLQLLQLWTHWNSSIVLFDCCLQDSSTRKKNISRRTSLSKSDTSSNDLWMYIPMCIARQEKDRNEFSPFPLFSWCECVCVYSAMLYSSHTTNDERFCIWLSFSQLRIGHRSMN